MTLQHSTELDGWKQDHLQEPLRAEAEPAWTVLGCCLGPVGLLVQQQQVRQHCFSLEHQLLLRLLPISMVAGCCGAEAVLEHGCWLVMHPVVVLLLVVLWQQQQQKALQAKVPTTKRLCWGCRTQTLLPAAGGGFSGVGIL